MNASQKLLRLCRPSSVVWRLSSVIVAALITTAVPAFAEDGRATHANAPSGYVAASATAQIVTNNSTFAFPTNSSLEHLLWTPTLPPGWTLLTASGDGAPEVNTNDMNILFTGALTSNPVVFRYTFRVPTNETGAKSLRANVEYTLGNMVNPTNIWADPDPLPIPMLLTINGTFTAANKIYDGTKTATITSNSLTLVGVITGEEGNVTLNPVAEFASPLGGTHTVSLTTNTTISGPAAGHYTLSLAGAPTTTATITRADQTITFPAIPDQAWTNQVILAATASSGLPVTFTVGSGPAEITGGTLLSFTGIGVVSIVASQAGNANWNAAPNVVNTFNVTGVPIKGIVNADFDGDRKADPAVYDENTGTWTVMLSGAGYYKVTVTGLLGGLGWTLAVADYDGDGRADPAVYQESTGNWAVRLSGVGYVQVNLPAFMGGPGWAAIAADYDGDGSGDPGVYQESTGDWKVKLSTAGYWEVDLSNFLGGPGYSVISADYDGDGLADPAVYNRGDPSTASTSSPQAGSPLREDAMAGQAGQGGTWIVRLSSAGYLPVVLPGFLGGADWNAVPGDYDGDGLADPAVRNALGTGEWKAMLSSANYTLLTVQLGL